MVVVNIEAQNAARMHSAPTDGMDEPPTGAGGVSESTVQDKCKDASISTRRRTVGRRMRCDRGKDGFGGNGRPRCVIGGSLAIRHLCH